MALNQNQFNQEPVQGEIDLQFPGNTITCQVAGDEAVAIVPGQALKLVDTGGGVPKVTATTADTDNVFGFAVRNFKNPSFEANQPLEVGWEGAVIYMTSGAAIARGAKIEYDVATKKVITNAGVNPVCGFALDKATAADQLIRVVVNTPGYTESQTIADIAGLQDALDALGLFNQTVVNVVTLAEVNAGKTIQAVATGKKAIVSGFIARCVGAFAALDSIELNVGAAVVASLAQAQLTNGAVLIPGSAGVTLGAGFGIAGADGADITVSKTGATATTATSITFTVVYSLIDA